MWQHGVKSRGSERRGGSLRSRGGTAGGMLALCVGMEEATEQRHGHRQAEISPLPPTAGSFPTVLAQRPPPTSSSSSSTRYPSHPKSASGLESVGAWIPAATISRGDIHERERDREGGAQSEGDKWERGEEGEGGRECVRMSSSRKTACLCEAQRQTGSQ